MRCRPGRLDKVLYVPLPPPGGRAAILGALTRRTPLAPGVDLAAIGAGPRTAGFSGADLAALVREAAVASLKARGLTAYMASARVNLRGVWVKAAGADLGAMGAGPRSGGPSHAGYCPLCSRPPLRCYNRSKQGSQLDMVAGGGA